MSGRSGDIFYHATKPFCTVDREELIDCVQADMDRAHEQGAISVMEKYAWMMASTAPEQFKKLHHF